MILYTLNDNDLGDIKAIIECGGDIDQDIESLLIETI